MELKDEDYIVNVGPQGTFQRSGNYQTLPKQVDAIFTRFEAQNIRNIALFFHGGLVSETSGLSSARNMAPHIVSSGCTPICFVWETSLKETLTTNITKLGQTSFFQTLLKFVLKKVTQKTGIDLPTGRGNGEGLSDTLVELELEKPTPFQDYDHWISSDASRSGINLASLEALENLGQLQAEVTKEIQNDIERNLLLNEELNKVTISIYDEDTPKGERGILGASKIILHIAIIVYKVIVRFIKKTDHGVYPTIIEEILRKFYIAETGAWVWKAMKDKSFDMWNSNNGRSGHQQFAGRYFLDKLAHYTTTYPDTKVNLIGHSAGSIAICNLFAQSTTHHGLPPFHHIILMAPACRIELFTKQVLVHPNRFTDVRIFTMSDENECKDVMIPYFYTRSLLYLISGILEDNGINPDAPLLGLERHIAFNPPYNKQEFKKLHHYLYESGKGRLCYAITSDNALDGLRTHALKHGDFDNDKHTLASITHILTT